MPDGKFCQIKDIKPEGPHRSKVGSTILQNARSYQTTWHHVT